MQVNVPLDLEEGCWACERTGVALRPRDNDENGRCSYCEGIGTNLTNLGEAVIEMLKRHKAKLAA